MVLKCHSKDDNVINKVIYIFHILQQFLINFENDAGAVTRPNGILVNSNKHFGVWKLALGLAASDNGSCQWPLDRSIREKYLYPANLANISSAFGIGSASNIV
jgi:hypothetical protein